MEALSPLVLRLWLNVSQDVLKHDSKQLGMMFNFALLLLRFSSRVHFDASLFTPLHEFITDLCTMRINFEQRGRMYGVNQGQSAVCAELGCFRIIVSKGDHSGHGASFADHMQSFRPFSWDPPWQFFNGHGNACKRRLDFNRGGFSCHAGMSGSFASRAFEVSCSFQGSLLRVCVPEMTYQDVVLWMAEIHVQASQT